jgi:hypothetical protein
MLTGAAGALWLPRGLVVLAGRAELIGWTAYAAAVWMLVIATEAWTTVSVDWGSNGSMAVAHAAGASSLISTTLAAMHVVTAGGAGTVAAGAAGGTVVAGDLEDQPAIVASNIIVRINI